MSLNTLERDDLLRQIAWLKARTDKIERMLKGEQVGTAKIKDAAITNAKIDSLEWGKARGGTAILGGLDDVNGEMSIHDEDDIEKILLNKDGIAIKGGKLTIENEDDELMLDASGIRSTTNFFQSETSNGALNQWLSSDADITGSDISFDLARDTLVLILFSASVRVNNSAGNSCNFQVGLYLDSVGKEALDYQMVLNGDTRLQSSSGFYLATLPQGSSYALKLRGTLTNVSGTPAVLVYRFRLTYITLGT